MQLELREYQTEALAAVEQRWDDGLNRVAVILPTGSGKTVIFSAMSQKAHGGGMRPLILVHRDELVNQAADKLHSAMPDAVIGRVKAEHNDVSADAVVASVQTLAREKRRDQLTNIGTIIVDEAHHALAPSYRTILDHFGAFAEAGRGLPTSGWTATLARGDGQGLGTIWQDVAYERDILWMIDRGYLVDVEGKRVTVDGLDLASVARSRGDFQAGDLGDALMSIGAGEVIAAAYLEHAKDRRGVLFAPTVQSAFAMSDDLNAAGIATETVVGFTDLEERADIYERFRTGETQVLANCMVLTEGWDAPWAEVAVIARPTESAPLYVQMAGRVLRPWPGKQKALILDVVGVAGKHRLATIKDLSGIEVEDGESISEARERIARERGEKGEHSGVIAAEDIDLFGRSHSAWLQTYAGIWFVPTREHVFFLWPTSTGHFWVGRCSNRTTKDGQWLAKDVMLEYGMAWAEQQAAAEDPSVSRRTAAWRTKRQPPSEAQLRVAKSVKLPVQGKTKAEVSDMLSVHFASRLLDPVNRRS